MAAGARPLAGTGDSPIQGARIGGSHLLDGALDIVDTLRRCCCQSRCACCRLRGRCCPCCRPCPAFAFVIVIEACSGTHHWARLLRTATACGCLRPSSLRSTPARMSDKRGKNDAADTAAIVACGGSAIRPPQVRGRGRRRQVSKGRRLRAQVRRAGRQRAGRLTRPATQRPAAMGQPARSSTAAAAKSAEAVAAGAEASVACAPAPYTGVATLASCTIHNAKVRIARLPAMERVRDMRCSCWVGEAADDGTVRHRHCGDRPVFLS